jgi:hypothetical protein
LWKSQIEDPQSDDEFEGSPGCSEVLPDSGIDADHIPFSEIDADDAEIIPIPGLIVVEWWRALSQYLSPLFRPRSTEFERQLAPAGPGKYLRYPRQHLYTKTKEPKWESVEQRDSMGLFSGWKSLKTFQLPRSDPFVYEEDRSSLELWK